MRSLSLFGALGLASLLAACGACSKSKASNGKPGSGGGPGTAQVKSTGPAPVTQWPAGAPQEKVDGDGFVVTFAAPPATPGSQALAVVEVKPKKPYHLNHEYPTELHLTAPDGVALVKVLYENNPDKQEAKVWHDEVGVFEVAFTAKDKGAPRTIQANFLFAVCTEASCDPKTATLSIPVVTP